ncbi:MAG: hypothetical protein ACODAQ_03560 [Phycisphaeraceae bacterium]
MAFHSGRVTFCRFRVTGDAPTTVDDTALSILSEHAFRESEIGAPDEVETGFTTGEHLLDTQFTYEKNGYGEGSSLLLFALRLDTHKVPGDVKQAYRKLNEQAAAEGNPSGFASKGQKREAQEIAGRQIQEDLAAGKFRKSKAVPLLWDLAAGTLYCGASGNSVIEALVRQMRDSFNVELELLSAGRAAGEQFKATGRTRDWEDLHPSPFTAPPSEAHVDSDDADGPRDPHIPSVPWCAKGVDLKDFLGNEFLLWLWWMTEAHEGTIDVTHSDGRSDSVFVALDRSLDMECAWGVRGKQSLRGDGPTRFAEAGAALFHGKWPRKAGLILSDGESQWELTLQADQWVVSSGALPPIEDAQSPRELTEARLRHVQNLARALDGLYASFLQQRGGGGWSGRRDAIRQWIRQRREPRSAVQPEPSEAPDVVSVS